MLQNAGHHSQIEDEVSCASSNVDSLKAGIPVYMYVNIFTCIINISGPASASNGYLPSAHSRSVKPILLHLAYRPKVREEFVGNTVLPRVSFPGNLVHRLSSLVYLTSCILQYTSNPFECIICMKVSQAVHSWMNTSAHRQAWRDSQSCLNRWYLTKYQRWRSKVCYWSSQGTCKLLFLEKYCTAYRQPLKLKMSHTK